MKKIGYLRVVLRRGTLGKTAKVRCPHPVQAQPPLPSPLPAVLSSWVAVPDAGHGAGARLRAEGPPQLRGAPARPPSPTPPTALTGSRAAAQVVHENTSTIRGMVHKIKHMVDVEPIWVAADAPPLDIAKRVRPPPPLPSPLA